ncbi:MAG: Dabb family protein [Acidobacteria bacterium]|nr:Dabb family protein [Acidobacteriota bacterium]
MVQPPQNGVRRELTEVGVERFTARDYRVGPIIHVVLFRYRPDVSQAEKDEILSRFLALAETERAGEPYIESIVGGPPMGGESAEAGFEYGFIVTFASAGDRNYYVGDPVISDTRFVDPVHADFKRFVGPFLSPGGVLVFDVTGTS